MKISREIRANTRPKAPFRIELSRIGIRAAAIICVVVWFSAGGDAQTVTSLHRFSGGADGGNPAATVVSGPKGNLFGTMWYGGLLSCNGGAGCGTIFTEIAPATPDGKWTFSTLYQFTGGDDGCCNSSILARREGKLYGVTNGGVPNGSIFELAQGAGGKWQAAEEWLVRKSFTLAASSHRIERDNLKHLRPYLEKRLVTDIQAKDVSRYQQVRLAEGAAPKTINLEVGTLRGILRRHRMWAEIQQDVRMFSVFDDVGHAITPEEEAALLAACLMSRSRCLYLAVMLALNTRMRYSEIRLLRWRQVDFAARILTVGKSKSPTGTGRAIPLNSRILSVLEIWAAQFPARQPAHFVFAGEKYGAAGEENSFGFTAGVVIYDTDPTRSIGDWKEAWEKAKERAGAILSGKTEDDESEPLICRFHDLRRTAVTRLLEAGVPYPVMASMMGWSAATAIRLAKRYGHIGNKALRDAADVLGRARIPAESLKKSPKWEDSENVFVQ